MELDHNPTIHQQVKDEVNQKKRHVSGTTFKNFTLEKISTNEYKSLLTSSQAKHKLEIHYNKRD
jgi:hypothetical protein